MRYERLVLVLILCSLAAPLHAVQSDVSITFEGAVAGPVVFNGTTHAASGLKCNDCHESKGFSGALFARKRGADLITMKKIERGMSCGACHEVSLSNTSLCSKCHRR